MARLHKSSVVHVKYPSNTRKLPLSKAWKVKNVSLFQELESKRTYLEVSAVSPPDSNKVETNAVDITEVNNIYRTRSKTQKFAFVLDGNGPLIFLAGSCESESQEWMKAIRNVLWDPQDLYSDSQKEEDYYVSLIETPSSIQAGLTGLYGLLKIKSGRVSVQPVSNKAHQVNWTLPSIRQLYLATAQSSQDRDKIFMLQTQDNSSGDYGEFCFYSRFAREILRSFYINMQSDINELPSPGKLSPIITPKMPRSRTETVMCRSKRKRERTRSKKRRGVSLTPTRHCKENFASSVITANRPLCRDTRRSLSESNILCIEVESHFVHPDHHYEEIGVPIPSGSFDALAEESNEEGEEQSKDVEILQGRALSCGSHNSCDSGVRSSDNTIYSSDENDGGQRMRYGYSRLKGETTSILEDNLVEEILNCEIGCGDQYHPCQVHGLLAGAARSDSIKTETNCDIDSGNRTTLLIESIPGGSMIASPEYARICKHAARPKTRSLSLESNASGVYEEIPVIRQNSCDVSIKSSVETAAQSSNNPPPLPPRRPSYMNLTSSKSSNSMRKIFGIVSRDYKDKGYVTPEEERKNLIYQVACTPRRGKRHVSRDFSCGSVRTLPRNWRMTKMQVIEQKKFVLDRSVGEGYIAGNPSVTSGLEKASGRFRRQQTDKSDIIFKGVNQTQSISACSSPSGSPSFSRKLLTQGQTLMRRFSRERSSDRKLRKNLSVDREVPLEGKWRDVSRSHTFFDFRDPPRTTWSQREVTDYNVELRPSTRCPRRAVSDPIRSAPQSKRASGDITKDPACSMCEFNSIIEDKSNKLSAQCTPDPCVENPYLAMDRAKSADSRIESTFPPKVLDQTYLDMNQIQSAKSSGEPAKYSNEAMVPSATTAHSYVTMAQLKQLGEQLLSSDDVRPVEHSKEPDYVEMNHGHTNISPSQRKSLQ